MKRTSNKQKCIFCLSDVWWPCIREMLRKILLFSIMFITPTFLVIAQNVDKSVTLGEVEIKAAQVINKSDGMLIYPSEVQKEFSDSGYSLLQKLSLPNIRIDEVACSVITIDNRGSVQLRIDGIVVGKSEMMLLDPNRIRRIDFIESPGIRYGDDIAYVINIITKRADSGYTIGTNLTQSVANSGEAMLYGNWNIGRSEVSLSYDFNYKDFKGNRLQETTAYVLNDGSVYTVYRNDFASRDRFFNNTFKLSYNFADSLHSVFQISLTGDFCHVPDNNNRKNIMDDIRHYVATQQSRNLTASPVLDIYYYRRLTSSQSFVLNMVGTYIDTDSSNSYDESSLYHYTVDGKTYSLIGETLYENRLKYFTFSSGINYMQKSTRNEYGVNVTSLNVIHNNRLYAFADIKGSWNKFFYAAGIGASYLHYSQQKHNYDYWLFRPKLSLGYNFVDCLQLKYDFQCKEHVSRIAMISDAMIRINSMEWIAGSPDLKPNRDMENVVRLSYNNARWHSFVQGSYKMCIHSNMAAYERTVDDKFIYTQRNQKEIDALNIMLYTDFWIIPDKLSVMAYGGLFRCFNWGDDYTHCYTAYYASGNVNAYIGDFSLSVYADNGWRFLEGETRGYNGFDVALKSSYKYKNWQFSIIWQRPLISKYKMYESEVLNRNLNKVSTLYSTDNANLITFKVSWRLNKGRRYKSTEKTIHLADDDTGIIR